MGIMVAEEFGGAGADYVSHANAIADLAASDGACSTVASCTTA